MKTLNDSFADFSRATLALLQSDAQDKGYAQPGDDGRPLIDFVFEHCGEGHSLGEIVYKVTRWVARRDPTDLLKIHAWAFLEWDRDQRAKNGAAEVTRPDPALIETEARRQARVGVNLEF